MWCWVLGRKKFAGLTALLAVESTEIRGCITYMSLFIHVVQTDSCETPYCRKSLTQCVWYYTHGKTRIFQFRFHTAQVQSTCLVLSNLSLLIDLVLLVLYHFTKCSLTNVFVAMQKERTWVYKCIYAMSGSGETNYTTNINESIKVHKETVVTVKFCNMSHHYTRQAFDYPNRNTYTCMYTYIYIC